MPGIVAEEEDNDIFEYCYEKHLLGKSSTEVQEYLANRFQCNGLLRKKKHQRIIAHPVELVKNEDVISFLIYAIDFSFSDEPPNYPDMIAKEPDFQAQKKQFLDNLLEATVNLFDELLDEGTEEYLNTYRCLEMLHHMVGNKKKECSTKVKSLLEKYFVPKEDKRLEVFRDYAFPGGITRNFYTFLKETIDYAEYSICRSK